MSNQYLKLRRSGVPDKIPSTSSIDFGEIALNTYDGKAYMKKSGSNGEEVVAIGSNSGSFNGNFTGTFTGSLQGTASWAENYNETDPIFTAVSGTFVTTASFNAFTSSYNTGSFTGRFSGSFSGSGADLSNIPASAIVGLNLSRISSGSVTASVSPTGTIFTVASSSVNILSVSSSGMMTLASSGSSSAMRLYINGQYPVIESSTSFEIILRTNGQDRLKIADNITTNVPIRLATPTSGITPSSIKSGVSPRLGDMLLIAGVSGSTRGDIYVQSGSLIAQGGEFRITTGSTDYLRVFPSTGNVFVGSTAVDGGFKLDVNGTTRLQNTLTISAGGASITGALNAPNITGSLHGTASWAQNTLYAITASAILGGKAPHIPYFITDTTLATSSLYQSGSTSVIINQDANTTANPEALYVWQPHPTSINVISGKGNIDNYLQLNIQNTNQGADASSDVVATANNGSEVDNYIDMGINSENFTGFLGGPNDTYVYSHGHDMWIGNINDGYDVKFFNSSSISPILTLTPGQEVNVNTVLNSPNTTGSLHGTASWALNVVSASHAVNADFAGYAATAGTAANGGVTQLIAGSGVSLIPSNGLGNVTVIATGVGGVTILSGSNVTQSFVNSTTWNFNHNLGTQTPIISVFDSNYNQVIPQNIQLVDTTSSIITFPTPESGFAIASVGGVTGNALSASYSLLATYADTASFYQETDPVFVARSASLATTGSNVFRGNQTIIGSVTITGSLTVSGSNTFTKIGPSIFSGSVTLVNGATGSLLGTASFASTASYTLSSSFASTASYVNPLFQNVLLTGSLLLTQSYISTVDYVDFTTTATPTHLEGRIHWDVDTKTLQIDTDVNNFAIPTGHTSVLRGKNQNNFTLTKGRVVYISGEQGNTPTFATASWDNEIDSAYAIAIVAQDINSNNNGYAVTNGILTGINTNAYAPSTLLYLSSSGQYTDVKPTAPKQGVRLGQVITQAINGSIYVKVDNGYEIGELHDVVDTTTTSSFGDLLVKSGSIWINTKQLTGSYAITGSLTVSGSGTFTNIGPSAFTGSVGITGSVTMAGNIVPTVSSSFSLGSITNPWKEIFLKSGSISMESDIPGAPSTTLSNVNGNILLSAGGMQLMGSGSFNAATGSFGYISGSLTQVGNYTRLGNTVMTGSSTMTGSFTVSGPATFNDGVFVNGNKQYNYGQFSSTTSQSGSINVTSSFNYDTTDYSQGVSIVSGSRITFTNGGIYNISAATTVNITTNVTTNVYLWLRKNGNNVANSTVFFQGRAVHHYLALNHAVSASAGDYFEVMKMYDADAPIFTAVAAAGSVPAAPSILTTVTQIA